MQQNPEGSRGNTMRFERRTNRGFTIRLDQFRNVLVREAISDDSPVGISSERRAVQDGID